MSSRIPSSQSDELEEIIYYITEMRRKVNSKMDDFFFIIEQQNKRIHEQNTVIDELAWQLRDLRDSVRDLNSKRDHCACNYENHIPSMKNSLHHKFSQSNKNNFNKFTDQNNNHEANHFDNAEDDSVDILEKKFSLFTKNREQTDDNVYEPIEVKTYPQRLNNLLHQDQQNSSSGHSNNNNHNNNNNNRASLKKLLINENNYDNNPKKVQYSKSCTNADEFEHDSGFRKDRNKVRDAQSEQYAKPNISMAEAEVNDDVILRRQTMVVPKANRNSYRGSNSGLSSTMPDIEEESISDKMKPEPRGLNYSRQKMRPSSFKSTF